MKKIKFPFGIRDLTLILVAVKIVSFVLLSLDQEALSFIFENRGYFLSFDNGFRLDFSALLFNFLSALVIPPIFPVSILSLLLAYFVFRIFLYCGRGLETLWGYRQYTFFILLGLILCSVAPPISISGLGFSPDYIDMSVFLAFAFCYPNIQFLFFFVHPYESKDLRNHSHSRSHILPSRNC